MAELVLQNLLKSDRGSCLAQFLLDELLPRFRIVICAQCILHLLGAHIPTVMIVLNRVQRSYRISRLARPIRSKRRLFELAPNFNVRGWHIHVCVLETRGLWLHNYLRSIIRSAAYKSLP